MRTITRVSQVLFLSCLAFTHSCYAKQTASEIKAEASYARLCKIYEEINSQQLSDDESADRLVTRLHIEVPELDYVIRHIFNAAPSNVYGLYKDSAKEATNKPWDCPAIKEYYQFDKKNNP